MRCRSAVRKIREGRKFCSECAAAFAGMPQVRSLKTRRPRSSAVNAPQRSASDAKPIANPSPKQSSPSQIRVAQNSRCLETLEGERKTVTALFADIKGSTELMADLDPRRPRHHRSRAKLMIDAVHRYDGYVVQSTGDGIFALFGAPVAHEDHPQGPLHAAIRMQEELKRYAGKLRPEGHQFASSGRREHGRSGGAIDYDGRGADRVYADRKSPCAR